MKAFSLNLHGRLVEYRRPVVMGILNVTPDSFYAGSRAQTRSGIVARSIELVEQGADMIDVGACSTRPGSMSPSYEEELSRIEMALGAIREGVGDAVPVSVDTFRSGVARRAVELGADIINDISGGEMDEDMFLTVAELRVPYVLMHMRGTPATMQSLTDYEDVTTDVIRELSVRVRRLEELGVGDVIIDPGFGFAKTLEQNYKMLADLRLFEVLGKPVLAGMSRKSMLTRLFDIEASSAEIPTAIAGAYALDRGASILRVHDPRAASQSVAMYEMMSRQSRNEL